MYRYYTIQAAKNKGADQTAGMGRLICTCVVGTGQKQVFSRTRLIYSFVKSNFVEPLTAKALKF